MQFITRILFWSLLLNMLTVHTAHGNTQLLPPSGVILLYHHVSNTTPRSTSVTPVEFAEHLAFIDQHYEVVPLTQLVEAIKGNQEIVQPAVAITFDDGFENILENGHPLLRKYGFPYTIFINPQSIGVNNSQLDWQQIAQMQQEGVSFANHTLDHLHLLNQHQDESQEQWLNRVWQNVENAERIIEEKTGISLKYLAYPYGEFNLLLSNKAKEQEYIAFGQHSGAIGPLSPLATIPRFPAAGPYAKLPTLKTKLASLPMPVTSTSLPNPQLSTRQLAQPVTITLAPNAAELMQLPQIACYFQGESLKVESASLSFSFTLEDTIPIGRSRVNCTAPAKIARGRYYWYSMPFFVANANGKYPD